MKEKVNEDFHFCQLEVFTLVFSRSTSDYFCRTYKTIIPIPLLTKNVFTTLAQTLWRKADCRLQYHHCSLYTSSYLQSSQNTFSSRVIIVIILPDKFLLFVLLREMMLLLILRKLISTKVVSANIFMHKT